MKALVEAFNQKKAIVVIVNTSNRRYKVHQVYATTREGARCWVAPPVGRNVVMRVTGGAEALCGHIISDHHIIIMGRCQNRRKAGQHCSKISKSIYRMCLNCKRTTAQGSIVLFIYLFIG